VELEVERILASRLLWKRTLQYKVKWVWKEQGEEPEDRSDDNNKALTLTGLSAVT
jgi:hypothetical protein